MTYSLRTDIPLTPHPLVAAAPQGVFELDNGDLVALAITTAPTHAATLACLACAWLVDAEGDPKGVDVDADAQPDAPVLVRFPHTADVHQLTTLGVQGIADALRDMVLGEAPTDPPAIPWAAQLRAEASIRNRITVARAAGQIIDWSN